MIGVIDYGAGNIRSISRGLEAAGAEVQVFDSGDEIAAADAIVLPGVGHVGQLMRSLEERGFDSAIRDGIASGKPYLGICVGLQIIYDQQEEGNGHGLAILPGAVTHLPRSLKTPHMGWSEVEAICDSPFAPRGTRDFYYFVHSYAALESDSENVVATTLYGRPFPAVVIEDNIWGCQFHPEKSAEAGLRFLATFVSYVNKSFAIAEFSGDGRVKIFPAIDIRGGHAVRLVEGDFNRETVFDADPVDAALRWQNQGATHLHVVDLDGARDGDAANGDAIRRIRDAFVGFIQVGGGVRTKEDADRYINAGINRIVLGSIIINDPIGTRSIITAWPKQVAGGLDARDGKLAISGWKIQTQIDAVETAQELLAIGLDTIIFTDIARDGQLSGPNIGALATMSAIDGLQVIASGGMSQLADVEAVAAIGCAGVIIGRALYDGRLNLSEALLWQQS